MIDKTELKHGWHKLTVLQDVKDRLPLFRGHRLSSTEFAVLCLVAHQDGVATITSIIKHPYFVDVSLSTIKTPLV